MHKIYDCSRSSEAPPHRSDKKTRVENEMVRLLKKYAHHFDCEFVDSVEDCDVIFTNDIFPARLIRQDKRLVKRMDGLFGDNRFVDRNWRYLDAAKTANHVIFDSNYSYKRAEIIDLKYFSIICNRADESEFKFIECEKPYDFCAVAADWSRPEKRLSSIIKFANETRTRILLIGHCDVPLPSNIFPAGYISRTRKLCMELNKCKAMLNLSYRDPSPKAVAEAVACGLPVLYADSGGTGELVCDGVKILERHTPKFYNVVPELYWGDIASSYQYFQDNIRDIQENAKNYNFRIQDTMCNYFREITNRLVFWR